MVEIPLTHCPGNPTGEFATVGAQGVYVNGKLFYWDDLSAALYAASQCCREGSRKHDDLFQASYDYLPSLKRQAASDDPEDALTFCGMERPQ